ncbi:MAG: glycosyltransferase [Chitinispirillaceae bacterium]|nr:glycosyltransferase [Chitinispirillaceae bacterium]
MTDPAAIRVSVVVVNYKVPLSLRQALRSLREAEGYDTAEVIVVDNASGDGSRETITAEFPEIKWVQLKANIGFGKACNVGARNAAGEFLLFLNPDTIVSRGTLVLAVDFMDEHEDVGLLGAKTLNPDGTMQPGCRRGFPTPEAALYHFIGLSRLFPKNERFGGYHYTWLDPDDSSEVDAVSGSCMFIRRHLFETIGGFDERFFMYGEDLDLCRRVHETGSKVWYYPAIQIIHLKGRSSGKRLLKSTLAFYEAMIIYSRKYRHLDNTFFPAWIVYCGILAQAVVGIGSRMFRAGIACFIDLMIINTALWAGLMLRLAGAGAVNPYSEPGLLPMLGLHSLQSASFLVMFAYFGIYSHKRYSVSNLLVSAFFASVIFMTSVYFIKSLAFSRLAFAGATIAAVFFLVAWRHLLPLVVSGLRRIIYARDKVIIIGAGAIPRVLIGNIEQQKSATITGILWAGNGQQPGEFEGYPVLGRMEEVAQVLSRVSVDMVLVATALPWYSHMIEALARVKAKNLTIRWVPNELFEKSPELLPETIPLHDFSV